MNSSCTSSLPASALSPSLCPSGFELDADPPVWHSALEYSQPPPVTSQSHGWFPKSEDSLPPETFHQYVQHSPVDIVQPAPTRHIDAKYLESQSLSQSPEMMHPPHPPYHHYQLQQPVVTWPAPGIEYDHEYVFYPGSHAEVAPAAAYHSSSSQNYQHPGATYSSAHSSYIHMQPSSECSSSYAQPYPPASYSYPINSPTAGRRNSYVLYTPISSNPSSGTTSPQFEYVAPQCEYERINSIDGSESLLTPITPTMAPHPRMPPNLLLGHSGITSEPIMAYPYPQHEVFTTYELQPVHHETQLQPPAPYVPPSPISPILEHTLASNKDVPSFSEIASQQTAAFISETVEDEDDSPILLENVDVSPEVAQSQAQAAERLKKLRERRHVVACTFCRGRKIACHSPVPPSSTEADDNASQGVAQLPSSPRAHDDEYKHKGGPSSEKRVPPPGTPRSACENCLRRGRECIYPPRVPRVPRRRRKAATAAPVPSNRVELSSPPRYPVLGINTQFLN